MRLQKQESEKALRNEELFNEEAMRQQLMESNEAGLVLIVEELRAQLQKQAADIEQQLGDANRSEEVLLEMLDTSEEALWQQTEASEALRLSQANDTDAQRLGLAPEFIFGRRVYKCTMPSPGVGYRTTPQFTDMNKDAHRLQNPECIVADGICQGPDAVFVRCANGGGWLPLFDSQQKSLCFQHLGKEQEVDMNLVRLENVALESQVGSPQTP